MAETTPWRAGSCAVKGAADYARNERSLTDRRGLKESSYCDPAGKGMDS